MDVASPLQEGVRSCTNLVICLGSADDIMEGSPEGQRAAARKGLHEKGVYVVTHAKVTFSRPPGLTLLE
jgi:NADH dehydrogenase FAD-containing subunit